MKNAVHEGANMPRTNKKLKRIDPPVVLRTEQPPYTPIAMGPGRVWSHTGRVWKEGFVGLRIGPWQGESNLAMFTPSDARTIAYQLLVQAEKAEQVRARSRGGSGSPGSFGPLALVTRKTAG